MRIRQIIENKKRFLPLLLLADEQENMIDRYLTGAMYVLDDHGIKGECIVIDVGNKILEIKNIAVFPNYQRKGYGRALINFIVNKYSGKYLSVQVGTGDVLSVITFYEKCGFARSHCIKNFFLDNYTQPIYEGGIQLTDMIYLRRDL